MSSQQKAIKVIGLEPTVANLDLELVFRSVGKIAKSVLCRDASGNLTGHAFVIFQKAAMAQAALERGHFGDWTVSPVEGVEGQELQSMLLDQEIETNVLEAVKHMSPAGKHRLSRKFQDRNSAVKVKTEGGDDPLLRHLFRTPTMHTPGGAEYGPTRAVIQEQPKLPVFSGIQGKDTSFGRWKNDVRCLQQGPYEEFDVLSAVRRSLRSPAADLLIHLGHAATVDDILQRFQSRYGTVLTGDAVVEKFYTSQQGDLDCAAWASHLEDLIYQAMEKGAIAKSTVSKTLRSRYWRGLKDKKIQEATRLTWDSMDFDDLVSDCRALEEEYSSSGKTKAPVQQISTTGDDDSLAKILNQLKEMTTRLEKLEKGQARKPIVCYKCQKPGHLSWGCRPDSDEECEKCHQKGHIPKSCRGSLN